MSHVVARLRLHLLRALLVLGMALQPMLATASCCEQGPACCATMPGQVSCATSCALPALEAATMHTGSGAAPAGRHAGDTPLRMGERHRDIWRPPRA